MLFYLPLGLDSPLLHIIWWLQNSNPNQFQLLLREKYFTNLETVKYISIITQNPLGSEIQSYFKYLWYYKINIELQILLCSTINGLIDETISIVLWTIIIYAR